MKKDEREHKNDVIDVDEDELRTRNNNKQTQRRVVETTTTITAKKSAAAIMEKFTKPDTYAGNRKQFDRNEKKRFVKDTFKDNKKINDPYTGQELVQTIAEAKEKYGEDWVKHMAEGDHIVPLEKIFDQNKNSAWLSNEDIEKVANSKENFQVVSRKFNNAKRSRTQKNLVQDEEYLQRTGLELTKKSKKKALEVGEEAQKNIEKKFTKRKAKNVVEVGKDAGIASAKSAAGTAAAISVATNAVEVIKGDKDVGDAAVDVVSDTVKASAVGFGTEAGVSVLTNTLAHSSSDFIKALAKSNMIADVVYLVMSTGKSFVRYVNDEISIHEMADEVAVAGVEIIAGSIGFACGGPIGSAVFALVASVACDVVLSVKQKLILDENKYKSQINLMSRMEEEALQEIQYQRKHLEEIIKTEFQGWDESFDIGFQMLIQSANNNDFLGFADGIDTIMSIFQSEASFHKVEEVENILFDDGTILEF